MTQIPSTQTERQRQFWNGPASAPWVTLQARLDRLFAPVRDAGLARARPASGEQALDIGCGCGDTTLALARAVGSDGSALGLDISAPMLARARERGAQERLANVGFELADAATFAFAPARADLVFSRLGVMFFGDAPAAFANLRRATRTGGRLVSLVPRAPAENPYISTAVGAARPFLPPDAMPVPGPEDPWMFSLADPSRVRRVLDTAGWHDIGLDPFDPPMLLEESQGPEAAAAFSLQFGPLPRVMADLPEATRGSIVAAVADTYRAMGLGARVELPGAFWIITATA
jgi:SAM-dependent methyltransferase